MSHFSSSTSGKENNSNNNDEYDNIDDSFLANFDVEAAVQKASPLKSKPSSSSKKPTTSKRMTMSNNDNINDEYDDSFLDNFDVDEAISNSPQGKKRMKMMNNDNNIMSKTTSSTSQKSLEQTLEKYFGYPTFRKEQLPVIQALVGNDDTNQQQQQPRDAAVFWATGAGKSICYQIPPLHTGKIALIVSPLISLMQDQCNKLNGLALSDGGTTSLKKIATFLGSGQTDANEENAALNGQRLLVYVTPEKITSKGFLDKLSYMHQNIKPLCLIAVDESHCVSEWGNDFRPEFRIIGKTIRNHPILGSRRIGNTIANAGQQQQQQSGSSIPFNIPLLALTATAIPRVQTDICTSLQLCNPYISKQSFDRTNLKISVHKKTKSSKGFRTSFDQLINELIQNFNNSGGGGGGYNSGGQSTIVYVSTRDQTEEIANYLQQQLQQYKYVVESYHGGMSYDARKSAHMNFLIGKTTIIVATVAFGMGIDKPDTRRIVHYGPPKTIEEYYQQIGRAGRDGMTAECIMYVTESDFDRYKSDFYLSGISNIEARNAIINSIDTLRSYALETEKCRRKLLLDFFNEIPNFGDRCGTCDTCLQHKKYGSDMKRDFGPLGVRVVLRAVDALNSQSMTNIEKVINGNVIESYKYKHGYNPTLVSQKVKSLRNDLGKRRPISYFQEMISPLISNGYLSQSTKKATVGSGQYARSWTTYDTTMKGRLALSNVNDAIMLPVTQSIRDIERIEEERRQKVLSRLRDVGVKLNEIPKEELDKGDGDAIKAQMIWHGYLDRLRNSQQKNDGRLVHVVELRTRIEQWRLDTAQLYHMAPATVLSEHILVGLAYMVATSKPGMKVEKDTLIAAGVRTRSVDKLVTILGKWVDEFQPMTNEEKSSSSSSAQGNNKENTMVLPSEPIIPSSGWEYAIYKPNKKTGLAAWESSHDRFNKDGENAQTIAMSPVSGKPIQVSTVVSHILDGLTHGRPTSLQRLAKEIPPPNKYTWEQLQMLEVRTGMDVTDDPLTSGPSGTKFTMSEFLRPVMGDVFIETPYNERLDEDKKRFSKWCDALKWYSALRRIGYEPQFSSTATIKQTEKRTFVKEQQQNESVEV